MLDSRSRFLWGSCGYPGNSHDSITLQSIRRWKGLTDGIIIPDVFRVGGGGGG